MNTTENPKQEQSKRVKIPRWLALILNILILALGHVAVPWAYSLVTVHLGWVDRYPGWWNLVGLAAVFTGLSGLLWCLGLHFAQAPQTVEVTYIFPSVRSAWRDMLNRLGGRNSGQATPVATTEPATASLVMRGPYRFSRHPMYLSVIIVWLGWALFYGSIVIFIMWLITWLGMTFFVAPSEEQQLETRFGESYRQYKNKVPRWFGHVRN